MPAMVPGEREVSCSPYVVGMILGSPLAACRETRRVNIWATFDGEGSCPFLGWGNGEMGCARVVVLEVSSTECERSLGIAEWSEGGENRTGAMSDDKPTSNNILEASGTFRTLFFKCKVKKYDAFSFAAVI